MAYDFEQFKKTYFEECAELLEMLYSGLATLSEGQGGSDNLHTIFRAVHSIKGGAGAFGFSQLVGFSHVFETLLDEMREGRVIANDEVSSVLTQSADILSDLIGAARDGIELSADFGSDLRIALEGLSQAAPAPAALVSSPAEVKGASSAATHGFVISFVPHPDMLHRANEPLLLFRELKRLGAIAVEANLERLPPLDVLKPEDAYLSWTIRLETSAPREAVAEVFEFVEDDCALTIEPLLPETTAPHEETDVVLAPAPTAVPSNARVPDQTATSVAPVQSIRVDIDKVDRLINLVGELVINQSMLAQMGSSLPPDFCPGLIGGLESLSQHLREVQESVMAIRAQPVRSVFARMPRLVREVAKQLGKEVRLVMTGEGTEIDKTVIEQLSDPLTHLLRNALDHGVESPEIREAAGKARTGTVHLSAEHRGGRIVIEVVDDGRGIDKARVLAKAIEKNLVSPDAELTDEQIFDLLFLPGFSTAQAISAVSGRGVGMDVVNRNIQALGGRISVESNLGQGSRFSLSLPLTLAILDGMVVAVGEEAYIVPLTNIVESLRPRSADIHPVVGAGEVMALRGDYVPLVYLHHAFGIADAVDDPSQGIVMLVECDGGGRIGLVVDELIGQQQVVVKSLESNYAAVEGVGGATILGTGRVALILDVAALGRGVGPAKTNRPRTQSIHRAAHPATLQ